MKISDAVTILLKRKIARLEDALAVSKRAMQALLKEPYGCSLCDSGKPRDPARGHQPSCPYDGLKIAIARCEQHEPAPSPRVEKKEE